MKPNVSLLLSTYDRSGALEKVLLGVARQTTPPAEVLIADDGADPGTQDLAGRWQSRISAPLRHFRHEEEGVRKTMILNQCVAAARGNYLVLLDGDCVPHRQFIADHAAMAEEGFWVQGPPLLRAPEQGLNSSPLKRPRFSAG